MHPRVDTPFGCCKLFTLNASVLLPSNAGSSLARNKCLTWQIQYLLPIIGFLKPF